MTSKPLSTSTNNLSNQQQQPQHNQTSFTDDSINSSFWNNPFQYRNETVY